MFAATEIMAKIRETPDLDTRVRLFSDFLKAEFNYDGFVYGISLDASSVENFLQSFHMKMNGLNQEWLDQYVAENMGPRDLSVLHAAFREGILHQSRVFDAVDAGDIPDVFSEIPNRVRDYSKSGFFLSVRSRGLLAGIGIHSSTTTPEQHDRQFVKYGHIVVELCRQFHDMACWKQDIVTATGLSEMNLKVLELRSQGLLAKQIIEITGHEHENSVAQHMRQVRERLRATNDRQAMMRASNLGLTGEEGFSQVSLKQIEQTGRQIAEREKWLGQIT